MLYRSLQSTLLCVFLVALILNPYLIAAHQTNDSFEEEAIGKAINSILQLPDIQQQFPALLELSQRNALRMNPFTVQYLDDYLSHVAPDDPVVPAAVNFLLGEFFNVNFQQFYRSLFFYKKAIALVPATEAELQLMIWERISALSLKFSKLEDAIPATDSCIVKAGQQQAWFILAHCLKCKGDIRRDYFQEKPSHIAAYQDALTNYKYSFRDNVHREDTLAALLNLFFITSIYLEADSSHQQAGAYIDTAFTLLTAAEKYDDFRAQNVFLKGKLLVEEGKYPEALGAFAKAYDLFAVNEDTARLSQTGLLVGQIHFQQGDYPSAVIHSRVALELSPKVNSLDHLRDIQYLLYQSYRRQGDDKNALVAHEAYMQAKDQINRLDQLHLLAAMEAERGLQEKEEEIEEQQVELEKRAFINRFLWAGTLILLALLGLLLFSFIRIRKVRDELAERNAVIIDQKQKLEELDHLKSRFFTNISHELRTPLTLILAPVKQLLEKHHPDKAAKALLQTAEKNTLLLYQLVDELLDFNKIESGKVDLQLLPRDIDQLLRQIMDGFLPLAEARQIQLHYRNELSDRVVVDLDQNAFHKILNNLLSNALKFSPAGSELQVFLSENEVQLLITVIDNGPGIYADDLPFIFDRFYQSRHEDVQMDHSTGIGLALSAELALLMRGQLWAESKRGEGSQFFLQLPKATTPILSDNQIAGTSNDHAHPAALSDNNKGLSSPDSAPGTARSSILIIEDHEELRNYLADLLGEYYRVVTASNGREALQILANPKSELLVPGKGLIISDMMMPVMDGYELLQILKSDDQYAGLPIIMLTALTNHKDRLKALAIGVDDYLVKPFDNQELLIRVYNLLHRSWERSQYHSASTGGGEIAESETFFVQIDASPDKDQLVWLKDLESFSLKNISNSQFSVAFLSNYANMSERNFQRHIKKATGMTPSEYIKEIRLHQARELLETGQVNSVKAVSKAVGFSDQEYFSTVFQGRFGRKPSTYLA